MASVYVSIGSNMARETNICSCMQRLRTDFQHVSFSGIYETPAIGFEGNPFLNLVAGFTTSLSPQALRTYLRQLEDEHGRVRNQNKYSARTLDVDLLLYDDVNLQPDDNLPHSDILTYAFVLLPLAEIAPEQQHPVLHQSIRDIACASLLTQQALKPVSLPCELGF
jgi:2-amino-4-hydroxy-6-hydroxymethyldihydropteridine diphosphokinase